MKLRGFTFFELLIVVFLLTLLFSFVTPSMQRIYEKYKAQKALDKVRGLILKKKTEAFYYGERIILTSEEGKIMVNGEKINIDEVYIEVPSPIIIYPTGATQGGVIIVRSKYGTYELRITAPTGELMVHS